MLANINTHNEDIRFGGSPNCSDPALEEFTLLREMGQEKYEVRTLNFKKAKFQLFREIINRITCVTVLRNKGVEQNWQIFKEVFHKEQELAISRKIS